MKLSLNFVKDYVDIAVPVDVLAEDMTRVGNEYDYAGKTRNYFTHLSEIENTYKENKLIKYIMIIDLIFLNKLLDRIGLDEKKREKIILDDESYMMINIKSFSTSSNETLQ